MVMKVDYGHCTISVKWLQKSHVSLLISLTICYACWLSKNDLTKLQANLLSNLKSKLKGTGFSSITILFDPWDSWIAMIKISSFNNHTTIKWIRPFQICYFNSIHEIHESINSSKMKELLNTSTIYVVILSCSVLIRAWHIKNARQFNPFQSIPHSISI